MIDLGSDPECRLVSVPGQTFWHTHICEVCGSYWTHIAPTPMTQRENRRIHTCTKCGTEVWKFVQLDEPKLGIGDFALLASGVLLGAVALSLFDRRQ